MLLAIAAKLGAFWDFKSIIASRIVASSTILDQLEYCGLIVIGMFIR